MEEKAQENQETQNEEEVVPRIFPHTVNDIAARLTVLLTGRYDGNGAFQFYPRNDVCGIQMRIRCPLGPFWIDLTDEQVYQIMKQAAQNAGDWLGTLENDMMRMMTEDGTDPRVVKPDEHEAELAAKNELLSMLKPEELEDGHSQI